ncbi:MAG: thymidine kinase [Chloroflexota bacterium]
MFNPRGSISVITGPMFSGKTAELIRQCERARIARRKVVLIRPALDDRTEPETVRSRFGVAFPARPVPDSGGIDAVVAETGADVVAIEEGQFFDAGIVDVCERLADRDRMVIVDGLNRDFLGRPFGPMPELLAIADEIVMLSAICMVCGGEASRTQRLVDGRPATPDDPLVVIGGIGDERYEARCRVHHEIG